MSDRASGITKRLLSSKTMVVSRMRSVERHVVPSTSHV
jgi:hypothetical protein